MNAAERQALLTPGIGCFVFTSGNRTRWEQVRILAWPWDHLHEVIGQTPRPFISSVRADGSVALLL